MKYEITARRLKEAMSDMNMTQQELSDKSKIGKSSISHYVNGTNEPGNKSAYEMARVLCVNPAWLMGFDVPKHNVDFITKDNNLIENKDDTAAKAFELYKLYENATPEAKQLVENFLKSSQQES